MPVITGRVERFKVTDQAAFLYLRDESDGALETFVLWGSIGSSSAFDRITSSFWVAMIRDAARTNSPLSVAVRSGSAQITEIDQSFPPAP